MIVFCVLIVSIWCETKLPTGFGFMSFVFKLIDLN